MFVRENRMETSLEAVGCSCTSNTLFEYRTRYVDARADFSADRSYESDGTRLREAEEKPSY